MPDLDEEQQLQEAQYDYPYHYVPTVEDGRFSQLQYWSWGLHYLGGIQVVLDQLEDVEFDSLVDVGCGDGRFLRELAAEYPSVDSLGVDYSERSVALAGAMNPDLEYEHRDILEEPPDRTFDAVTSIEVLEHIDPDDCEAFVGAMADLLVDDGVLVLTVPHRNKPVNEKHYQHFDADALEGLLEPHFTDLTFVPFDRQSKLLTGLEFLLGWRGRHYVINTPLVTNALYRFYTRRYLYADDEANCRRLAVRCRKA